MGELVCNLQCAFGNEVRLDYGTGHETSLIVFFFCVYKLGLITTEDLKAFILSSFVSYVRTVRKLQMTYMLEPAGSHGVWGLDDYHCLVFLFGAAQVYDE